VERSRDTGVGHRVTAADWHGGQGSALYAYASTGTVVDGLVTEIRECLDLVERGASDPDTDAVGEHARLTALLAAVQPQAATRKARAIGRQHGENAAAWWNQDALGGRATGDTTAIATRVLQGIEDGDPAVIDALPDLADAWSEDFTPGDLAEECLWPEPDRDDTAAHQRWTAAQPAVRQAYEDAFVESVENGVAEAAETTSPQLPMNPAPASKPPSIASTKWRANQAVGVPRSKDPDPARAIAPTRPR
jgi:hypothetical protein